MYFYFCFVYLCWSLHWWQSKIQIRILAVCTNLRTTCDFWSNMMCKISLIFFFGKQHFGERPHCSVSVLLYMIKGKKTGSSNRDWIIAAPYNDVNFFTFFSWPTCCVAWSSRWWLFNNVLQENGGLHSAAVPKVKLEYYLKIIQFQKAMRCP